MSLDPIRQLVSADLKCTDQFIVSQLASNIPLTKEIVEYVLNSGGKRIRPMVLLLSTHALNYTGNQHIDLAAVIELIHTATLLHDDVVDQATLRRGHQTANIVWGTDASVLVGDFLYSRAFQIVVDCKQNTVLDIFARATPYIAEGEILQLINCHHPDTTEQFYFDIIKRKTATLFEVAAQLGATLAGADDKSVAALAQYGLHLGLAYQLIDDALDYSQSETETGKNIGQDIADGKTTLPLIHALHHCQPHEVTLLRESIQTGTSENLAALIEIIESTKAIQYTADAAKEHVKLAKKALSEITPSAYREALLTLSDFVVERTY